MALGEAKNIESGTELGKKANLESLFSSANGVRAQINLQ